ncbi:PHP domain-containing protein [Ferruginibacter sp.]
MKKKLTFNFHVHTSYSEDGYNTFSQLYKHAQKNHIDVLAITDHDTIDGAVDLAKWIKAKNKKELQIIAGEEVTCADGTHIIGLFLKNNIIGKAAGKAPIDVVKEIKAQGAFVYFPHPDRKDGILNSEGFEKVLPFGDFYEYFNAKINNDFNESAVSKLAAYTHLKPLGGSDAHYNYDIRKCKCTLLEEGDSFSNTAGIPAIGTDKNRRSEEMGFQQLPARLLQSKKQVAIARFCKGGCKKNISLL